MSNEDNRRGGGGEGGVVEKDRMARALVIKYYYCLYRVISFGSLCTTRGSSSRYCPRAPSEIINLEDQNRIKGNRRTLLLHQRTLLLPYANILRATEMKIGTIETIPQPRASYITYVIKNNIQLLYNFLRFFFVSKFQPYRFSPSNISTNV